MRVTADDSERSSARYIGEVVGVCEHPERRRRERVEAQIERSGAALPIGRYAALPFGRYAALPFGRYAAFLRPLRRVAHRPMRRRQRCLSPHLLLLDRRWARRAEAACEWEAR